MPNSYPSSITVHIPGTAASNFYPSPQRSLVGMLRAYLSNKYQKYSFTHSFFHSEAWVGDGSNVKISNLGPKTNKPYSLS